MNTQHQQTQQTQQLKLTYELKTYYAYRLKDHEILEILCETEKQAEEYLANLNDGWILMP